MTLDDWLAAKSAGALSVRIAPLPDRKIHLLTAALLRRAWGLLPSHHTQVVAEATEAFADGRMTKSTLARLRVTDTLQTSDPLWLSTNPDWDADEWAVFSDYWGELAPAVREQAQRQREQRVADFGYVLPCVKAGIEWPHWVAAKAAFLARELRAAEVRPEIRERLTIREAVAQFRLFREVAGDGSRPNQLWRQWRSATVIAVARSIHANRAFDQFPILADALQDAGCNDEAVLDHCREPGGHVRGCWVLDLALGLA